MPEVTPAMEAALSAGLAAARAGTAGREAVLACAPELFEVELAVSREIRARGRGEELTAGRAVALLNAATTLQRLALEALVDLDRVAVCGAERRTSTGTQHLHACRLTAPHEGLHECGCGTGWVQC